MLSKHLVVVMIVMIGISVCVAATRPPKNEFKNLKVLPRDISSKDLTRLMVDDFQEYLGVSCNFCHAEEKGSHKLDYASDEKPEKLISRSMMRMTLALNKKYFQLKRPVLGAPALEVTCNTCHHGQARPENVSAP